MLAMVFAAGLGTRLRPLTERLPKPVVPLLGRPLAAYALERLAAAGVTRCAINTHHLADAVPRALEGFVPEGLEVSFVHEPRLLGTGGGLKNGLLAIGADRQDAPIFVMNGDIFFWPDLDGALALHRRLGAVSTVILRRDARAKKLGALETDAHGRVRRLLGAPEALPEEVGALTEHMFTGVHVLAPRAIADLPDEGCVIRGAYRRWIDEGEVVGGFVDDAEWRDLGTPGEYHRMHMDLLSGAVRWPGAALPDLRDGEHRGAGASVGEGATLRSVSLGAGASVAAGVQLERSVVWPGAEVLESGRDVIAAPHARIEVAQ